MVSNKRLKQGLRLFLVSMILGIIGICLIFISIILSRYDFSKIFVYYGLLLLASGSVLLNVGFILIYVGLSQRYRGLILVIIGLITCMPSIIFMVRIRENAVMLFNMYIITFLTLLFVVPGMFFICSGRKSKIIPYYESIVSCTFFLSLTFLLIGISIPDGGWDFFFEKFWICLGGGFIMGCMITGTVLFYFYVEMEQACFTFCLGLIFIFLSIPLVMLIFF